MSSVPDIGPRNESSELFADLIDRLTDHLRRGEPPDLDALCVRYPLYAGQLRRIFPAMVAMNQCDCPTEPVDCQGDDALPPFPKQLGGFELIRPIGRGGMGVVYLAKQPDLNREVAIKLFPFAALLDKRHLARFRLEARAAAMLKHPGIVSVYSFGVEHGIYYFVMEYIDGISLAELIAWQSRNQNASTASVGHAVSNGPGEADVRTASMLETTPLAALSTLSDGEGHARYQSIARVGRQIALALHYAHQHGIIHRDIKPSNLMINRDGEPQITDFGLARVQTSNDDLTLSSDTLGTLRYMSPEQMSRKGLVDGRTDVYSLGLTLYELIVGQPAYGTPARNESRAELIKQVLDTEPTDLRHVDPHVPRDLATIVHRAAAKEVEDRYQSATDLADDLQAFLDRRPIQARPSTQVDRLLRFSKRNPRAAALVALCFALVTVVALTSSLLALNYRRQASEEAVRTVAAQQQAEQRRISLYARDMRAAKQAADEAHLLELLGILERWVPSDGQADLRGFEWFHLWQYCEDPAVVASFGHELPVYKVAFLPGNRLAASDFSRDVSIWDIDASDRPPRDVMSQANTVSTLFVDPATSRLIMGDSNGNVNFHDLDTLERVNHFRVKADLAHLDDLNSLSFHPDGSVLAIAGGVYHGGAVFLRDLQRNTTRQIAHLPGFGHAAFARDGHLFVAAAGLSELRVYRPHPDNDDPLEAVPLGASGCYALDLAPDGELLALALYEDRPLETLHRIELWSTSTRHRLWSRATNTRIGSVEFSDSGRQLAWGTEDGMLEMATFSEDAAEPNLAFTRKLHAGDIRDICFSPDEQQLATASLDFATVWDLSKLFTKDDPVITRTERELPTTFGGCFVDSGRTIATAFRGVGLVIWDAETGKVLHEPELELGPANHLLTCSAPERGLVCLTLGYYPAWNDAPGRILVWDQRQRRIVDELPVPVNVGVSPSYTAMSPDGKFVAVCSHDNDVYVLDIGTKQTAKILDVPGKTVRFSGDGHTFACGDSSGQVHLFSVPDFQPQETVRMDERLIDCVDISRDGRWVAAVGFDRKVTVYDRLLQEQTAFEPTIPAFPNLVRISPGGERILTASLDGRVRLWVTETGDQIMSWKLRDSSWITGEFSPNGETIALSGTVISQAIHAPHSEQLRPLSVSVLRSRACQQLWENRR